MRLSRALEEKSLDVRVRDTNLAQGKLKSAEVKKYIDSLEDDSDNAELLDLPNSTKATSEQE